MAKLNALQDLHFVTQKKRANRAQKLGWEQNQQDRAMAELQHGWQEADLLRDFSRARDRFAGNWSRRGMMNSGLYKHSLGEFFTDRQTQMGRAAEGWKQQQSGFDLADRQLERIRKQTRADLDAQRDALLTVKTSTINNAVPY